MHFRSTIQVVVTALGVASVLPIHASVFALTPTTDVVGEMQLTTTKYEDSFINLAAKYNVGFEELVQANPHIDPWIPGDGTLVVIPSRYVLPARAQRKGIIINLAELRLYYFTPDGSKVYTYPVGIGRMDTDWKTPLGTLSITQKQENANWYVPQSIKEEARLEGRTLPDFIPPGADNPMGKHKMRLSNPSYLIHGTNKEAGIGRRVSHGCINMFNADVEQLYSIMPLGTEVNISHQPYKVGWKDGYLWLEAHQVLEDYQDNGDYSLDALKAVTQHATGNMQANIDWDLAKQFHGNTQGVPMVIGKVG
ncbi:MAG: L,D-transpeptidase family protein [Gammaproteobacteria bacterium]